MSNKVYMPSEGIVKPISVHESIAQTLQILRKRRNVKVISYLNGNPGELGSGKIPTALYDDGFNGKQRRLVASAIWPHLEALQDKHLILLQTVFVGGSHTPADLWNGKGQAWAKKLLKRVLEGVDYYAVLEYGMERGIHIHVILPFTALEQARAGGAIIKGKRCGGLVFDTWGMARYLAKPGDSRAALYGHKRQVVPEHLADAVTLYLTQGAKRFMAAHEEMRTRGSTKLVGAGTSHTRWGSLASEGSANVSVTSRGERQARRALREENWRGQREEFLQEPSDSPDLVEWSEELYVA